MVYTKEEKEETMNKDYDIVDDIESLEKAITRIKKAQEKYG